MPISVVVGGQFGSEGKGKVAHFLAREREATVAVRVGGPNSGHTVIDASGAALVFQHLPTASILPRVVSVLPPGSYLDPAILLAEIDRAACHPRVVVDPHAWVIEKEDFETEVKSGITNSIGSTGTGTGAALGRRIKRNERGTFAKDVPELKPYLGESSELLSRAIADQQRVIVEGTQGFGLSLLHSNAYPYCTSRDTIAAAFVSEAGLSPLDVDEVVLVIRAFPIRVSGPSGPLPGEIDWNRLTSESGSPTPLLEYTSVTKRVRRVARFDPDIVRRAILHNRPTSIALNHLDYIDAVCATENRLTQRALDFAWQIEQQIGARLTLLGYGRAFLVRRDLKSRKAGNDGT